MSNNINLIIVIFLLLYAQDGIQLIYENVLDYDKFAVRIKEDEIPQLVNILRVDSHFPVLHSMVEACD